MGSLHLYLPFSMEYRARAPSIRFRLLPTLRTFHLLVPPISMLQQHLPQHLSHQLPPLLRQLARDLIKTRFRMLFPPIPHRLKHLLRTSHKLRLRLFPIHLASPSLFSFLLPQVYLPSASQKIWDAPGRLGCWVGCLNQDLRDFQGFSGLQRMEGWLRGDSYCCLNQDLRDLWGFSGWQRVEGWIQGDSYCCLNQDLRDLWGFSGWRRMEGWIQGDSFAWTD